MSDDDRPSEPSSTSTGVANSVPFLPGYAFKTPESVKLAKNGVENWKIWKQLYKHYCVVTNAAAQSPDSQKSLLISTMGLEALQIYNGCDPVDTDMAENILTKLDAHILGDTNETFQRYKFNTCVQKHDESIDDYLASLKTLAKTCNFCECLKTSLLRDRIVLGVTDDSTRKRLLQKGNLTLKKALDICRSHEKTADQLKFIAGKEEVHRLNSTQQQRNKPHQTQTGKRNFPADPAKPPVLRLPPSCKFCGISHILKKEFCKVWGQRCNKCKELNHFARCCPNSTHKPHLHGVDGENSSESDSSTEMVFVLSAESVNSSGPIYAEMELKDRNVKFQVDCGATVNVISQKYFSEESLEKSDTKLTMYNKTTLKPLGKCRIIMRNPANRKKYNVLFEVVKEDLTPLFSRRAAERMKLITVNYDEFMQVHSIDQESPVFLARYKPVFEDNVVGQLPGKVHLKIDSDAKSVQCPPRRVPIAVKPDLENLVNLGVLKPVTEPTEWCSQISVQKKKNGKL